MLDKFIFENHLGQRFEGLPNGVYLNYSDLRDYSWSFDTINNRISRFYRDITERKIPLVVYCKSGEEAVSIMNRLHELAEADIVAKIPGKIYVGDYYTVGYITASMKSNYLIRKKYCKIELTLTSDDPVWYNEHAYTFISDSGGDEPDPATVQYAEGTTISINDSSDGFVKGLTLHGKTTQFKTTGKNLIGDNRGLIERTKNGITYTPVFREDGLLDYILVNGTATANSDYYCTTEQAYKIKMPKGATVVLSGGTENARVCLQNSTYNHQFTQPPRWTGQLYTGTLEYDTYGCWISVISGVTVNNEKIRPMVEIGTVATEYEPYTGGIPSPNPDFPQELVSVGYDGSVDVNVYGKNLLWIPKHFRNSNEYTHNGIKYTLNEDGSYTANGTATGTSNLSFLLANDGATPFPPGEYIISGMNGTSTDFYFSLYDGQDTDGIRISVTSANEKKVTLSSGYMYLPRMVVLKGATVNNVTFYPMIRHASIVDSNFEPCKEQTLSISTPNGLPGIPLGATISDVIKASDAHMAGVWWDNKTQQYYISNTKVCNSGVDTQIVEMATATGDENWYKVSDATGGIRVSSRNYFKNKLLVIDGKSYLLCSHFTAGAMRVPSVYQSGNTEPSFYVPYSTVDEWKAFLAQQYAAGTPVVTLGIIGTPIETPLSAEEIAQFSALRTIKPNTTVYNDGGAYMEIGYYPIAETNGGNDSINKGGTDYHFDYPYDYALSVSGRKIVCNSVESSAFRLLIYGEATNPVVIINGHVYTVNGTVAKGETLLIDSLNKTITLTTASGKKVNWFDKRGREDYIFEPLPAGQSTVTWSGTFGFDLTVVEKRSEPKWT